MRATDRSTVAPGRSDETDRSGSAGPSRAVGYLAIIAAAVCWAAGASGARYLTDRGASVLELTEARAWVSAAGLGLLLAARRLRSRAPQRTASQPLESPWLVLAFGLALAGANITYYWAITLLPVAVAIVVQYTAPALVVVWTSLVSRRLPSRLVLSALVLAVAGVAVLSELPRLAAGGRTTLSTAGLLLSVGASVSFATYVVVGERLGRRMGTVDAVFRGFVVASILWIFVQAARGRPETLLDPRFTVGVVFIAIVGTLVPFLLFVWGLRKVDASRAAIVSTLEPVAAALVAYVWLGEQLGPAQLLGGSMVLAGVVLVQLERRAQPQTGP
ncbi:MAG: DMT family transporter [Actinomycetota bacterium]|nr:DMT family transporter [Actinomycetota bacterium]